MNLSEYLLVCLMEEAAEVSQEAAKCLRFSPDHTCPVSGKTNLHKLKVEFGQLLCLVEMLDEQGIDLRLSDEEQKAVAVDKRQRMKETAKVSVAVKALELE